MRRLGRRIAVAGTAALALLGTPAALARAHGAAHHPRMTERRLRAYETATLGREHAAEHARERAALRRARAQWQRLSAAERRARLHRARAAEARGRAGVADAPADQVGRWDPVTIPFPTYAINTVLLPTGKVAFWGRAPIDPLTGHRANTSDAYVWDPAQPNSFEPIPPPTIDIDLDGDGTPDRAPIFCGGESLLPDGEVLVAGGNLAYPVAGSSQFKGLNRTFTLDPWTLRWTEQPQMGHGRWYPTQTLLPDGRTLIAAGLDETGAGTWNGELEAFTPPARRGERGSIARYDAGEIYIGPYPHMFTLADGRVLAAGYFAADDDHGIAALLDPSKLDDPTPRAAWTGLPDPPDYGKASQAVLLPGGERVAVLGGYTRGRPVPIPATNHAATIDLSDPLPAWSSGGSSDIPDLRHARAYGNLVQLPDGMLLAVGGGEGDAYDASGQNYAGSPPDQTLKQVELLRPAVDTQWRLGPPQRKFRTYHSTAILLPDGRVLSAGDDYWDLADRPDPYVRQGPTAGKPLDEAEIYSPPYLFDGDQLAPRPRITSVPDTGPAGGVAWGDTFGVGVADRAAARAVLVAPAATTHGNDMNQRMIDLSIADRVPGKGVNLRAPASAAEAPPGWYMLFVLDAQGTPSVARWAWLRGDRPTAPPLLAPDPEPTATTPPAPGPPAGGAPPAAGDRRAPWLGLRTLALGRGARRLRLRASSDEAAQGTLRVMLLGYRTTRSVRLTADRPLTISLPLPVAARRALADGHRVRINAALSARDAAGNVARRTLKARLRR